MTGKRGLWIPDTQSKPGVPNNHLRWAALYANDHQPDFIVLGGDGYDMPSLSAYDKPGSHAAEGRRVVADLDAGHRAWELFYNSLELDCPVHVTLGNHEDRVMRAVREDARLEGLIGEDSFIYSQFGWKVHPYQKVLQLAGVNFSHLFDISASGSPTGRAAGCPSARVQLQRLGRSCVAGHKQGYDCHQMPQYGPIPGRTAVIAGSFYQHTEAYRGPNGQNEWRGIVMLNDIHRGDFEPMQVSMRYLKRKYGGK